MLYPEDGLKLPTPYYRLAVGLRFHALKRMGNVVRYHVTKIYRRAGLRQ
jgi:hypothetical protein